MIIQDNMYLVSSDTTLGPSVPEQCPDKIYCQNEYKCPNGMDSFYHPCCHEGGADLRACGKKKFSLVSKMNKNIY